MVKLQDFNDYELLYMIRQNDDLAKKIIIKKYYRVIYLIIHSCLNNYTPKGVEQEELFQEGLISLFDAIDSFREDIEAPFYSFSFLCMKRHIKTQIRKYNSKGTRQFYNSLSLDMKISEDDNLYLQDLISQEQYGKTSYITYFEDDLKELLASDFLSNIEKKVLKLRVEGYSYQEIADILELSSKIVDNTIQKIKRNISKLTN